MNPRRLFYRHERKLIAAWFGGGALLLGLIAVWGVGLRGAERVVEAWNGRWDERLARAEELFSAARYDEAADYLERVEAEHPAVFVKHARDRERERLLELLGRSHQELGRKRRALETLERLAEFDPRNWNNHHRLGEARLAFGEDDLARESFERVLAIHPSHCPTVRALVEMSYESGHHEEVAPLFEAYLDAWLLARMKLRVGDAEVVLEVPVDGRERVVEAAIDVPVSWSGELRLETAGYSVRLASVELLEPLRATSTAPARTLRIDGADGAWQPQSLHPGESEQAGEWSAFETDSALWHAGVEPLAVTRVRVTLTAYKALPLELWQLVERSYRNTLDPEGLEAARARTVIGGHLWAGSLFVD